MSFKRRDRRMAGVERQVFVENVGALDQAAGNELFWVECFPFWALLERPVDDLPHARTDFSACGLNRLIQYATQCAMVKDLIGLHFVGEGTPVLRQPVELERI